VREVADVTFYSLLFPHPLPLRSGVLVSVELILLLHGECLGALATEPDTRLAMKCAHVSSAGVVCREMFGADGARILVTVSLLGRGVGVGTRRTVLVSHDVRS
jgi:hypothetical protein